MTLCSHSTANFPKNAFFRVVLSPLSGTVFGIWKNFPFHSFATACLLCNALLLCSREGGAFPHCFYRGGRCLWQSRRILHLRTPVKSCLVRHVHGRKHSSSQRCITQTLNSNNLCFVLGELRTLLLLADLCSACSLQPGFC